MMRSDPMTVLMAFAFGACFIILLNTTGVIQFSIPNQQQTPIDIIDAVQKLVDDNIQMNQTIQTQNNTITELQSTVLYQNNQELKNQVNNMNGARYIFGCIVILLFILSTWAIYYFINKQQKNKVKTLTDNLTEANRYRDEWHKLKEQYKNVTETLTKELESQKKKNEELTHGKRTMKELGKIILKLSKNKPLTAIEKNMVETINHLIE